MKKSLFIKFILIFLAITFGSLVVYTTVNLLGFLIPEVISIPPYMYILYGIGSVLGIGALSFVCRDFKKILIGLIIWLCVTVTLIIGYIFIINWNEFINTCIEMFSVFTIEFIVGYILSIVFSILALFISISIVDKQTTNDT